MQPKVPEKNKKAGVCYAVTDDGIELPVIDVTHPAFALQLSDSELDQFLQKQLQEMKEQQRVPAFLQRLFLRLMQRRSILMRGIAGSAGTFMSGLNTYLLKLGPDNLSDSYASDIDRRIAASLPALSARLRLQDIARFLAEGIIPALQANAKAAIHLLNIGGGPAIDSMNALILLQKEEPELLSGRRVIIHSLDLDDVGPRFGDRALHSLMEGGGPLHGLDIDFHHVKYDWSDASTLRRLVNSFDSSNGIIVSASSEGALFEYGSDEEVESNLRVLHETTPASSIVVGTVTRADDTGRLFNGASRAAVNLRGLEAFTALSLRAGWKVTNVLHRPISHDVLMQKV
ncbi:MAG: hypothetical protein ACM33V_04185 [Chloroflexota bacterium]|nr:hypothetical protein [Anaerolineales bacterium]